MKLIADSGSTKTDWALCDSNQILRRFTTAGMNPITHSKHSLMATLQSTGAILEISNIEEICFYGAGCTGQGSLQMRELISQQWPNIAKIRVDSDLLGAARAVCHSKPGIVAILGTGSNSAYSDGHLILHQLKSLGYLLGDEGSAADLCKRLLVQFYYNKLDLNLAHELERMLPVNASEFISYLYASPRLSFELASLFPFLVKNKSHPQIKSIIDDGLHSFFEMRLSPYLKYPELPLHFGGSVSNELEAEIKKLAPRMGFQNISFNQNLMEALIQYHFTNEEN